MAMTVIWTGMTALSLLCALAMGNQGELASAALDGAASAIELGISMAGVLCLWMGVMEVMQRAGLLPGIGGPWTPSPPMSRPTCWDWATPPLPWGWRLPGG